MPCYIVQVYFGNYVEEVYAVQAETRQSAAKKIYDDISEWRKKDTSLSSIEEDLHEITEQVYSIYTGE